MEKLTILHARAAPLMKPNIDTDAIIPSREMKSVSKSGLADGLFANWRYLTSGGRVEDPDFVLNQPRYRNATILVAGANFGCGSSREHAVWALAEYGMRCIIAPSFGAIFHGNCVRNGVLPIVVSQHEVEEIVDALAAMATPILKVDLVACAIETDEMKWSFSIAPRDRHALLEGLDALGVTLKRMDEINSFESAYRTARPWLFPDARSR